MVIPVVQPHHIRGFHDQREISSSEGTVYLVVHAQPFIQCLNFLVEFDMAQKSLTRLTCWGHVELIYIVLQENVPSPSPLKFSNSALEEVLRPKG